MPQLLRHSITSVLLRATMAVLPHSLPPSPAIKLMAGIAPRTC
jgi:hypothetical protein